MNNRIISAFLSVIALVVAASCTYDESDMLDGKGQRTVRLQTSGTYYGVIPSGLAAFSPHETKGVVTINRDAISNADLQSTVTVDVTILTDDSPLMIALNDSAENNDDAPYLALPTDSYTLVGLSGTTLTFGPGEAIKELQIKLDPSESYSFSDQYVLGIQLSNVSAPYVLSSAKNTILTTIVLKNIYDGIYISNGIRYNFASEADFLGWPEGQAEPSGTIVSTGPWGPGQENPLSTINEKTSKFHTANSQGGFGYLYLTVNSDNTVTITKGESTVNNLKNLVGRTSTYDPETGTFDLWYQYTNTADGTEGGAHTSHRVMHETAVYNRPQ